MARITSPTEEGPSFEDRLQKAFGYSPSAPAVKEPDIKADTVEPTEPAEGTPEREEPVVAAAPEADTEADIEEVPVKEDPRIAAFAEQNKQLSRLLEQALAGRPSQGEKPVAAPVRAQGLTAEALMDEKVRTDPQAYAQLLNEVMDAKVQAQLDGLRAREEARVFADSFYQRPENKRFAALRGTAMDPLVIAGQQLGRERQDLGNASAETLSDLLTERVAQLGKQLDAYAGKPIETKAPKVKVNQPGAPAKGARPSDGDASGSAAETDRGSRGLRDYFAR